MGWVTGYAAHILPTAAAGLPSMKKDAFCSHNGVVMASGSMINNIKKDTEKQNVV